MTPSTKKLVAVLIGAFAVGTIVVLARHPDEPAPTSKVDPPATSAPVEPTPPPTSTTVASADLPTFDGGTITSGPSMDLGTAMSQTKKVAAIRAALAAGDTKLALAEIEAYDKFPEPLLLKEEVTVLKIQTFAKAGRRTDALALAMSTRDDPAYASYQAQIEAVTIEAGLREP